MKLARGSGIGVWGRLVVAALCCGGGNGQAGGAEAGTAAAALEAAELLAGAEARFVPPSPAALAAAEASLTEAARRIGAAFAADPHSDATRYWQDHLRWELLERNLGPPAAANLDELRLVRRWMYSNRPGLESPFFAGVRTALDAYLDAAYVAQTPELEAAFRAQVAAARSQCLALATDPRDAQAAELGRTLGWLERTGQLPTEVAAVRARTSLANAQVVVSGELISRILATQATSISESIALDETVRIPPGNALQRSRTMRVRGTASTSGAVDIAPTPNARVAELTLKYQGDVDSAARGVTGPVTLSLRADGAAQASKPIYLGADGLTLGKTEVMPQVASRLTGVAADREVIERIARRRAEQPTSRSLMDKQARQTTVEQLRKRLDEHVDEALAKLRADMSSVQASFGQFRELTAPLMREGVAFSFDGARSTAAAIAVHFSARGRDQHGAAAAPPGDALAADVLLQVHVSLLNNVAETILGGKSLSDEFVMRYAKVVHAELPVPLMVHARAPRWSLTMARQRPLEIRNPAANRLEFVLRVDAVEIDGVSATGATALHLTYELVRDEFGDVRLVRDAPMDVVSALPSAEREFVVQKVGAFWGPELNGGGVVIPEGGMLGAIRALQSQGVHAEGEWLTVGWNVPKEAIDEFVRSAPANSAQQPPSDEPPADL